MLKPVSDSLIFIKENKALSLALAALLLTSFFLNVLNLKQGLPSEKAVALVLGTEERIKELSVSMESSRNTVFADYGTQDKPLLIKYFEPPQKKVELVLDGKKISADERKLHAARSVLLQSRYPDEQRTLMAISNIKPEKLHFDPGIYQYGGFYFYSCGLALKLGETAGLLALTSDVKHYFLNTSDARMIYLLPKLLGGLMAALGVLIAFLAAFRTFGRAAGLLTAALFAVLPSITFEAHCFKPYAFFIPFSLASLFFSLRIQGSGEKDFRKNVFFSSLFAGFSAGALVLSGFVVWSTILAYLFFRKASGKKLPGPDFLLIPLGFAASFLATNPYYLTSLPEIRRELAHLTAQLPWTFSPVLMSDYFFSELHKLYGLPVYLLSLAATVLALVRRETRLLILAVPLLLFYLYAGNINWDWTVAHYSMVSVCPSLLLTGYFLGFLWGKPRARAFYRSLTAGALLFTFSISLYYHFVIRANEANLLAAGKWVSDNLPAGSSIGTSVYPAFTYKSYPPFPLFDYRLNDSPEPQYYIVNDIADRRIRDKKALDPEFLKKYSLIKEFRRPAVFFDKIYGDMLKNNSFIFFEQKFGIYSRRTGE